jgi:hypothetical protein
VRFDVFYSAHLGKFFCRVIFRHLLKRLWLGSSICLRVIRVTLILVCEFVHAVSKYENAQGGAQTAGSGTSLAAVAFSSSTRTLADRRAPEHQIRGLTSSQTWIK